MNLDEQLKQSGQWLFERRSYLPLALVVVLAPAMLNFEYPGGKHSLDVAWETLCLAVSLTGLGLRVVVVGFAADGTSGRNTREGQVAASLNTTGPYSLVRHPLYFANYLMWLGVMLFPRAWWCPVIGSLAFWLYYERIVIAEESFLRWRFGDEWEAWARRTPTFLPSLRAWRRPARSFSLRRVLRTEYSALFAVIAVMTVLEVVGDVLVGGRFEMEPMWLVLFAVSAVAYVLLRTIKHRRAARPHSRP
ncbi:MAG TPA: isoprenylcysteine carboxylmethyltransferase family protein [Gemmatimonadaceae bacterium]|nr:isoprenylcysteine carboxylmethyltransferase family protein [Gemmatimonadaceae bacterium]